MAAVVILVTGSTALGASLYSCESLFGTRNAVANDRVSEAVAKLELHLAALLKEQSDVRDRVWTPAQVREIQQKGRIELKDLDRTVKYYRALVFWKARRLQQELAKIKEKELYEQNKKTWPESVRIKELDRERDVNIFAYAPDFHQAMEIAKSLAKTEDPKPEEVANVLLTMSELRSLRRTPWADRTKLETKVRERLGKVFSDVSNLSFEDLSKMALADRRNERTDCCGSGRCDGCTHPNVVFRNPKEWPGPVENGVAPASTLPLYRVMDRLKEDFPNEDWGKGFWDGSL